MILTSLQSTNFLVIFRYPADRYKHGHSNSNSKHRLHSQHKRISVVVLSPVRLMAKNHKCMIQNPQTSGSPSRKLNTIFLAPLPITPKISSTSFHAFLGYVASAASIQFYLGEGGRKGGRPCFYSPSFPRHSRAWRHCLAHKTQPARSRWWQGTSFFLPYLAMVKNPKIRHFSYNCILSDILCSVFTATCFSNVAVMGSLDVRPSVCLSVRNVGEQWSHTLR